MSELSSAEIDHLAKLARISLSEEEQARFAKELPKIVDFVEELQGVSLDKNLDSQESKPLSSMREDKVSSKNLSLEELKSLAPEWQDGQNKVPAVFGEAQDA